MGSTFKIPLTRATGETQVKVTLIKATSKGPLSTVKETHLHVFPD